MGRKNNYLKFTSIGKKFQN